MSGATRSIIVVGQGAAGLSAALSAAEAGRGSPIRITLVDKASADEAGGNTRWSPSYMRMAAPDRVETSFVHDMLAATQFEGEETYFARLAADAPRTVAWIARHGVEFIQPAYYLAKGPPRIQPAGGGPAIISALTRAARQAGVTFRYGCAARDIVTEDNRVAGLAVTQGEAAETIPCDAMILASGGFQANFAMMREQFGPHSDTLRLISPGTRFNTGDGIRMTLAIGADRAGDWNGMHIEPVDARAKNSAPVVLVYPYGIVVDKHGRRFFDEGAGLVHETWERLARDIHFNAPGSIAYAILDSRFLQIAVLCLSAGRRRRLHLRRPCDRRPRPRVARRRADTRPLRRRRDHRALPCHRAERRLGAARLRVRTNRRTRSSRGVRPASQRAVQRYGIAYMRPPSPHCREDSNHRASLTGL